MSSAASNAVEAVALSKAFRVRTERRTSLKERLVRGKPPAPDLFWALRDATFAVPRGSSFGIIGQNGSGKSTALKVLAGIYRPTSGQVCINGSVSALLEVGAGFHPELTGRENIRLNATILGFSAKEIDRMMDQIIEFADIGEHIDGPIKHYSSGMYVRLGFAVAVMVRPDILIVDEVIAVGDEEFQRKCYEYLYDLRRHGTSLLIVSHGLNQITDLCDEALWLKAGEVMEAGPSRKVVQSYLDSVNAREIEAAMRPSVLPNTPQGQAGPSPEDPADTLEFIDLPVESLPTRPIRRGSGEVWVTGIEYLNEEQAVSGMLISGRPATMRVHYRAETDVDELVLGIGVLDHKDQTPTGVNSSHTGGWAVPAGLGYVDFHATPLLLAAGSYRVTTIFHIGSHVVDVVDDGFPLLVREPGVEMVGAYLQPGSWSLNARPLRASVVSGD